MDLESYKNQLRDIYLVSNTPSFLYETMKKSDIVKDYLSKFDKKDLFIEFSSRIKETITDTSDIAILYALMISLTFKKDKDNSCRSFRSRTINSARSYFIRTSIQGEIRKECYCLS